LAENVRQELIPAPIRQQTELLTPPAHVFLENLRLGIVLTVLRASWGRWIGISCLRFCLGITYTTGASLSYSFPGLGFGIELTTEASKPSPGAVDNGTACAILLALADLLNREMRLAATASISRSPAEISYAGAYR
jgi:hypothetical protein